MADTASVIALTVPNNPNPDTARSEARGYCTPSDPPAALLRLFAFAAQVRGSRFVWVAAAYGTPALEVFAMLLPSVVRLVLPTPGAPGKWRPSSRRSRRSCARRYGPGC